MIHVVKDQAKKILTDRHSISIGGGCVALSICIEVRLGLSRHEMHLNLLIVV
jgi:hypothetical protein